MVWGALAKVALKATAKQGAKATIKGTVKGAAKKKLSANNIKSNLLKKRKQLKKIQIQREKQEADTTVEQSSAPQKTDSGKGAGNILGFNLGFFGKIINVTLTLIFSWVIRKVIDFTKGIGKTIDAVKPVWDAVMGTLEKMVKGVKWIFESVGKMIGVVKKDKQIEEAKQSLSNINNDVNKQLEKTDYGRTGDVDEEREDKKEQDQKDAVVSKALKESSDYLESEATINQVDDKMQTESQGDTNPATMLGKVDKIVKGKADKSTSKINSAKSDVHPAVQKALDKVNAKGLGGLTTIKSVNEGLGPTQKQKNKGKTIIQPVERIVRVGSGSGSSGGGGSSNIKSPAASLSGGTSEIP